jgi:hypothetical protein
MKVCYTAIIGHYEDLKEPSIISEGWLYICFTDQPLRSNVWKIIPIADETLTAQRLARKIKILPHIFLPDSEFTFWIDASFQINIDLNLFWARHFKPMLTAPAHPIRNCVYREIASCIFNRRGDENELRIQERDYKKENIPAFNGLITSGVLMRQQTKGCIILCDDWWNEIVKYSARDQVAFAKVSQRWKYNTFVWDYSQSKELKYIKHYHKRH